MRLFGKGKTSLLCKYRVHKQAIQLAFYKEGKKEDMPLHIPFSDSEFRDRHKWGNFDSYLAYEELCDLGVITEQGEMQITMFYDLMTLIEEGKDDAEIGSLLKRFGLPFRCYSPISRLEIVGLPAQNPDFKLHLKTESNENLVYAAQVELPFVHFDEESCFIPKNLWTLSNSIEFEEFDSGFEKTAKIRSLAIEASVELDDFLYREEYHYINSYEVVPEMIDTETLELKIIGKNEVESAHLNAPSKTTSIRQNMDRQRYQSSTAVTNDLEVLARKKYLKGEEIPQFFENPLSLFPEHDFVFDLESFSERVQGFVEIKRPRAQMKEGKWGWFDDVTGEALEIDREELKKAIQERPKHQFVPYRKSWIYVDKKLRIDLELENVERVHNSPKMALDIKDNEQELSFALGNAESTSYKSYPIPSTLVAKLYPHQVEGFNWICSLEESGTGGLLADDMGLGKTMQVITFLLKQKKLNKLKPSLIILPKALIENWYNEIEKFAPVLKSGMFVHTGSTRLKSVSELQSYELIFTTYDTLKVDQLLFGQIDFQSIIADEAQNVKSHGSQRSHAIRALKGEFRLAMTGTPVENSLEELWTIMDFVQPGALGSLSEFKKLYIKEMHHDLLMEKLKPFYLRRTKAEVLKDELPAKHLLKPYYIPASAIQEDLAYTMMSSIKSAKANMLTVIGNLRQLYAHPAVFDHIPNDIKIKEAPKLEKVFQLLDDIKKKNEKVLIFTDFRKVQSILKREISARYGIQVPTIDGSTSNRPDVVQRFGATDGFGVIVLSPKAAGVGLTITSANHVIHYTRWWNPAVENQATDRAYRIGQEKEVFVYQIITQDPKNFPNGTVEEIMHKMLTEKSELADNVIIPFDTSSFQKEVQEAFIANEN